MVRKSNSKLWTLLLILAIEVHYCSCQTCSRGQYFDGNRCQQCTPGCATMSCVSGYYLKGATCERCLDPCSTCESETTCTSCASGYLMDAGQCKRCSKNCESCSAINWCRECKSGYRLMSGNCYICPNDCDKCIDDNKCVSCSYPGHYVHNYACVKCPKKCVRCISNTECTNCIKGFYGTNQCLRECSANCRNGDCDIQGRCKSCHDGLYGDSCNFECQHNCTRCHVRTGICLVCETGTYVYNNQCKRCQTSCTRCTQLGCSHCVVGHWGKNCEEVCPNCKPGTPCRKIDGYCLEGCVDGMSGGWCNTSCSSKCLSCPQSYFSVCTACVANKYGYPSDHNGHRACTNDCPTNCLHSTCDDETGKCTFGCLDGYHGNTCKCPRNCNCGNGEICISCKEGFWNKNCECTNESCTDDDCSACISSKYFVHDRICCSCRIQDANCEECIAHVNTGFGSCTKCKKGFFPYKHNCTKCPTNCRDNTCDPITGECTSCKAGRWGTTCDNYCNNSCLECDQYNGTCMVCPPGRYSPDCSELCSLSCKTIGNYPTCALHDGACIDGCQSKTNHGSHCQHYCSTNCNDELCNWRTGLCLHGCTDHHYGNVCNSTCSQTCSTYKTGHRCYDTNGTCVDGCVDGYYGEMCENKCNPMCVNISCEQFTGSCLIGCLGRYKGENCIMDDTLKRKVIGWVGGCVVLCLIVQVIAVVVWKWRRHPNETGSLSEGDTYTEISPGAVFCGVQDRYSVNDKTGANQRVRYKQKAENRNLPGTGADMDYLTTIGDKEERHTDNEVVIYEEVDEEAFVDEGMNIKVIKAFTDEDGVKDKTGYNERFECEQIDKDTNLQETGAHADDLPMERDIEEKYDDNELVIYEEIDEETYVYKDLPIIVDHVLTDEDGVKNTTGPNDIFEFEQIDEDTKLQDLSADADYLLMDGCN